MNKGNACVLTTAPQWPLVRRRRRRRLAVSWNTVERRQAE